MAEKATVVNEIAKIWPRRILRVQMAYRDMTYGELAKALQRFGVDDDEHNLRNKVARGSFSATFFLQCLAAMDCKELNIAAFFESVETMELDEKMVEETESVKGRRG